MEPIKLPELGPLLEEDAALLQAIIKMTDPKVVVEFGFHRGTSARKMLAELDQDAKFITYDNTVLPAQVSSMFKTDPRFTFMHRSQDEFEPVDNIGLVFLDASHDLEMNKKTFVQLLPCLREDAIIVVHDTGAWKENWWNRTYGKTMPDGRHLHCVDERLFVNWVKEKYPEYQQIHLHSLTKIRHGITLLQKYIKLDN